MVLLGSRRVIGKEKDILKIHLNPFAHIRRERDWITNLLSLIGSVQSMGTVQKLMAKLRPDSCGVAFDTSNEIN